MKCGKSNFLTDFVKNLYYHLYTVVKLQKDEKPESEWVSGKEDKKWGTRIILCFHPNLKLTEAQTQAVIKGYKLDMDGCYRIETNRALAFYVKRKMLSIDFKLGAARWCLFDRN